MDAVSYLKEQKFAGSDAVREESENKFSLKVVIIFVSRVFKSVSVRLNGNKVLTNFV